MRHRALLALTCLLWMVATASAADKAGQADYLAGLDAMENAQWPQAIQSLTAATGADDEEPGYHLALGIAQLANRDARNAVAQLGRAYRLNGKDLTTRRWAAGACRYLGDETTAARIDASSDWPGVQQACQEYAQALKYQQNAKVVADKKAAFEAQVIAFARAAHGDSPEMAQAVGKRIDEELTAGKFNDALRDLQPLLAKDPWNEDLLVEQATALVGENRNAMARVELTHILSQRTSFGIGYAMRAVAEANLGNPARAKADWALAQQYDQTQAKAWSQRVNTALSNAESTVLNASAHDAWIKLRDAALADASFDQLSALALNVARIQNAHRRRWDEEYQDQRRQLEDAVRAGGNDVNALLALGAFLYREAQVAGEQEGPGGVYRAFRVGGAVQRNRDLNYALTILDRALKIDPKNAMALTWKAAIQLEYGDWNVGEQLVQQALAIRQDIPELLELLSRVLNSAAQTKAYAAVNLRTAKTWTQFGINYDVIWTRYPSQQELNRADSLDNAAQQLWANSQMSLRSAITSRAGTADGFYFTALLKVHDQDASAIDDFKKAAAMDPLSHRNRQAYVRALQQAGESDAAAVEQEKFTLEHETTATVRLAYAWTDIDRTAFRSASADLDSASEIDAADSRIAAYEAAILTAQNKLEEAAKWYTMALAQEEASAELDNKTLKPGAKDAPPLSINEAGFALLLNLRRAARYEQLQKKPEQLAALEWNCVLGDRIDSAARHAATKAEHAVLPNTFDAKAWTPKSAWNMVAWSHVLAGYCDATSGQAPAALTHYAVVADSSETPDIYDPQALAIAGKNRLTWGPKDPDASVRRQWAANALTLTRLSDQEIQRIGSMVASSSGKDGSERTYLEQQVTMPLFKFRAMPIISGGYDYRNNPNYKGSNDPGPDDLARTQIH